MSRTPHLSIVIPAYNESGRLAVSLRKLAAFRAAQPYPTEVILVDDGSSDDTASVGRSFAADDPDFIVLVHAANRGKGAAVRTGMARARGRFRLFCDADFSTPIEEANVLLSRLKDGGPAGDADVAIASRRVKGATLPVRQPIYREAAGRVFSVIVRLTLLPGLLDTQCGFKMFTDEAAEAVFSRQTIEGFGFDPELLFIARRVFRFRIVEVPVTWTDSPATRVRLLTDSTRMFGDIWRIRKNGAMGRYDGVA